MGTRGAVGVKVDGKYKVTYNHWDSYPDGLGKEVVEFCQKVHDENGWETLKKNMKQVSLVSDRKKAAVKWQQAYSEYCDTSVSKGTPSDWYCLLRNLQGVAILEAIYSGKVSHMINSFSFLKDSLFCEYAYIINLDSGYLEFYQGFNTKKDFYSPLPVPQALRKKGDKYYPVRFVGKIPLESIKEFNVQSFTLTPALEWRKED
jgi:hypothetical protein